METNEDISVRIVEYTEKLLRLREENDKEDMKHEKENNKNHQQHGGPVFGI